MGQFIAIVVVAAIFVLPVVLGIRGRNMAESPLEFESALAPTAVPAAASLAAQDSLTRKVKKGANATSPRTDGDGSVTCAIEVPKAGAVHLTARPAGVGNKVRVVGGDLVSAKEVSYDRAARSKSGIYSFSHRMTGLYLGMFGVPANAQKVTRAKNRIAKQLAAPAPASAS
jgi:hypothetical protein